MKNSEAISATAESTSIKSERRGRTNPVVLARGLVQRYFEALNSQQLEGMKAIVSPDIIHDVDTVERRLGREAFLAYLGNRADQYREHIFDIELMVNEDGTRAAAEYTLLGFPLSNGPHDELGGSQTYRISGGLFFQIEDGRIARVSQHAPPPSVDFGSD